MTADNTNRGTPGGTRRNFLKSAGVAAAGLVAQSGTVHATNETLALLGGEPEGWLGTPPFSEPAGLSYAAGKLYVADTNAHRIRVIDMKNKTVSTLKLEGVEPPKTGTMAGKQAP